MKRGDFVMITCAGQTKRARVLLASPNAVSVMLGFEGTLTVRGGVYFGSMPVLRDDDGVYRDLAQPGEVVDIELVRDEP
jgi:hypothetical protein